MIDIRIVSVTSSEMQLEWENTDSTSGYNYHVVLESECGRSNTTSSQKSITLRDLTPGTLYNVTVTPEVEQVQGDATSVAQYTRESCEGWGQRECFFHLAHGGSTVTDGERVDYASGFQVDVGVA